MTGKECMDWMRVEVYLDRWVLPQNGLLDEFRHYKSRQAPIGNHACASSWDHIGNKHHDDCVLRHVAAASQLPKGHQKKFSLATPKEVSHAYLRMYNNPPGELLQNVCCCYVTV